PRHGFSVAAIERERNSDTLSIVAPDLEAIGAPAGIWSLYSDCPIVCSGVESARVTSQEKTMRLHNSIHSLVVRVLLTTSRVSLSEKRMHPAIPVGGKFRENATNLGYKLLFGQRATSYVPGRLCSALLDEVRP